MADPLQTQVQVQDIPEYLRDYRSALLNAAFQTVFSKPHLERSFPGATWYGGGTQAPATPAPVSGAGAGGGGGDTRIDTQAPNTEADKAARGIAGALAMASGQMPKIPGYTWDPKTRTYMPESYKPVVAMSNGGDLGELIEKYAAIRQEAPANLKGDVVADSVVAPEEDYGLKVLPGGTVSNPLIRGPFGEVIGGGTASSWNIPGVIPSTITNTQPAPNISSGIGSGVGTGARGPIPAAPAGASTGARGATPATGERTIPPPSRQIAGAPPIGTPASDAVLPQFVSGAAGTTAASRGAGGYNPLQYATDEQAAGLASLLGAGVSRTSPIGPIGPPPQNILDFGDGAQLNAGLVQQALGNITVDGASRARTPSEMTQSLAGLRAEIAAGGGDTSQIDRLIEQNNQAYASGATISPVGQPAPTATPTGSGTASISNPVMGAISQSTQNMIDLLQQVQNAQGKSSLSGKGPVGMAGGGSLAQFDIGDDGKVKNYRRGGVTRLQFGGTPPPQNLGGFGTQQTPAAGGFGGPGGAAGFWNAANPDAQVGTSMFNAPPVYGGRRNLLMGGDFGQYTPGIGYTVSNLTRGALGNLGDLPSVYGKMIGQDKQEYTGILPGTDFGKGVQTINRAADIAGEVAEAGTGLIGQAGQPMAPGYLMSQMEGIKSMGIGTPISISQLTTPQMAMPTGITAGRTQVGEFGTPEAEQYMSPYQQAVTEAQKREAQRQAAMLKAGRSAAAVRAGAFGGSRQAVQEGMAEEALQRQLGDIEAVGRQKAFESAQAQFERDRAASLASQQANLRAALEAQLANQQAGLTAGQANLGAAFGTQQLGTQAGLEAARANQAAALGISQMQLDAIMRASAEEQQARQQGFANRLAALQQAQSGAAGLAGLGGTLMGVPGLAQQLELQRLAAMQQGGGAVDAFTRQAMDLAYQDFINQQNFPYQQMNFLQGILSGVPVGMQAESVQFQRPAGGGLSGLLTSGAGLLMNQLNR